MSSLTVVDMTLSPRLSRRTLLVGAATAAAATATGPWSGTAGSVSTIPAAGTRCPARTAVSATRCRTTRST
ncbi:twin-arginine translocation signal domain-containing protein [Streptomyces sp. NPDC056190]|uniref:twin-arginine translocation signal domain-containing protein n=1 Tax=unclassified Streptomyces TaxID=2593676 RepID=UPI0035DD5CDE